MMNGAHLKGMGGMAQMARGPSAADLMQRPEPTQQDDMLGPLFEAATAAGLQFDPMTVMQDPQAMSAVLDAAAKSDLGATDGGIDLIMGVAERMGLPSPFRRQQEGASPTAPDYATGGRYS